MVEFLLQCSVLFVKTGWLLVPWTPTGEGCMGATQRQKVLVPPTWTCCLRRKQSLQMQLNEGVWHRDIILDYLGSLSIQCQAFSWEVQRVTRRMKKRRRQCVRWARDWSQAAAGSCNEGGQDSPWEPPEWAQPAENLTFCQWHEVGASGLRNHERINFYCTKPASLRSLLRHSQETNTISIWHSVVNEYYQETIEPYFVTNQNGKHHGTEPCQYPFW